MVDQGKQAYLELLSARYPSIQEASTRIVNLTAELNLPKGTEHFISDIHGEFEAFRHVLRSGSGSVKRKIEDTFPNLPADEKRTLATLIYYPEEKLPLVLKSVDDPAAWYRQTLLRLLEVGRIASAKYSRTRVRQFLPQPFTDMIDELLHRQGDVEAKTAYYNNIIETIIDTGIAKGVIIALAELIQKLVIARLHVIGDVYDRGPGAHRIMDALMEYHDVDVQWGNHDILWMAAAGGSDACIANVIRVSLRYANMETLDNGYAISLLPLATFALNTYRDDPCHRFQPRVTDEGEFTEQELRLMAQMHKAITIIQLKLEGQIIQRRPHYQMQDRLLLDKIDFDSQSICLDGVDHPLLDGNFPTIQPDRPYKLTAQEQAVVDKLRLSFGNSKRLQRHVRFLYAKGGMYLVYNGNLLYHGCIGMNPDGSFQVFEVGDEGYKAKAFMDRVDRLARQGFFANDDLARKQYGLDAMWYLWSGPLSPLFGKDKMATFERYFIADESTHKETRNPYYQLRDRVDIAAKILEEFGLDPETAHIINGHVPVRVKRGESPVKADGKLLVIDGGFAKAYQQQTGIAGYTLVFNSYVFLLAAHQPFESTQKAIEEELDIKSDTRILETRDQRLLVRDTDVGRVIREEREDLQLLLQAYRSGLVKEPYR